ncbi:hypothetical protein A0J61_10993, partial [Choanephora cucurbitarum]
CECSACQLSIPDGYTFIKKRTYNDHQKRDALKKLKTEVITSIDCQAASEFYSIEDIDQEGQYEQHQSKHLPSTPIASLLLAMVVLLRKNQLADASCETVKLFCNMVLCLSDEALRFPSRPLLSKVGVSRCNSSVHPSRNMQAVLLAMQFILLILRMKRSKFSSNDTGELVAPHQYGAITLVRSFFHNSLIDTLKSFFLRDRFAEGLNKWKQRHILPETLSDIFDGRVWKNFKLRETDNKPFVLQSNYNLMLTLNYDWFQAYKDGYSVGAIYLTIRNLPREVGNLRSNSILVCLINGPKEPKTYEMNKYLRPLVKELLVLMNGVEI